MKRRFRGSDSSCVGKIYRDRGEIKVTSHSGPLLRFVLRLGLHLHNYSYCSFLCLGHRHTRCWGICCADDASFGWEQLQFAIDVSMPRSQLVQSMQQLHHHCFVMGRGWKHSGASHLGSVGFRRGFACQIANYENYHQYRHTTRDTASKSYSLPHASRDEDNFV